MNILPVRVRHLANGAGRWGRHGRTKSAIALLLLALFLSADVPDSPPAAASPEAVKWTRVNIPGEGEAGDYVLAPGSDVRRLAAAADGILYAAVRGLPYTLYRSADGGSTWSPAGNVRDDIVDIAVSPRDSDIIYYATHAEVFGSNDGGRTFNPRPASPGGAGNGGKEITSLAFYGEGGDIIAMATRDTDDNEFGGIYTLNDADAIPAWVDTGLGSFDAYAVAFSPGCNFDRRLAAVVTDETDSYVFTRVGDEPWNADIGAARLVKDDSATSPVGAGMSAAIAFPAGCDDDTSFPEDTFYVAVATGTGDGDVYRVDAAAAPSASTTKDLNAGAGRGENNIDITGLAARNDATGTTLLAISADARTYVSADGGSNWKRSRKRPSGDTGAAVLIPDDFGTAGRMYAATSGTNSAVSISEDGGITWDQVGLMDVYSDMILDLAPSPAYDRDSTLFMLTFGGRHSLWRSQDGGASWERTLCVDPGAGDVLSRVALPPGYGDDRKAVFIAGESGGEPAIWESTDNGCTFRQHFTRDPATGAPFYIDAWAVTAEMDLIIGGYDGTQGMVYVTSNSGFIYSEGAPVGSLPISSIAVSPAFERDKTILVGNTGGYVYRSEDGGLSFDTLPAGASPLPGPVTVAFDPGFETNRTVYAASDAAGSGIYRFIIGSSDEWQNIDTTTPATARFTDLAVSANGTLYAVNSEAGGGLERSLDPRHSSGATFENVTSGLPEDATLMGLWSLGQRVWSIDTTGARLMTFDDTLTSTLDLVSPDDGAGGLGTLIDHSVRDIRLDWDAGEGATGYEWQCNYLADFSDVPEELTGGVSASEVRLPTLEPATTYYWRVRASAPVLGPWSEKMSFTTSLDTEAIALRPESPAPGATGVPVQPFFQWTAVAGADAYELLVAGDVDFGEPNVSRTGEEAIPANAWQCDVPLEYAVTYYWKVRAISRTTSSPWSAAGVFTTEPDPAAVTPPTTPEVILPPTTSSAPPGTPAALRIQTPPPMPPPQVSSELPAIDRYYSLPAWIVYLIGALVVTVILSLIVVLAMVQKIRH